MVTVSLALELALVSLLPQPPARTTPHPIVEKARKVPPGDLLRYLRELGSEKKFKELRAILKSDVPHSSMAATVIAEALEPEKAVAFCASLEIDSSEWRDAIFGLRNHPKAKVIGYIKQMATSQIREVRAFCYLLCGTEGWDDLVSLAKRDLRDDRRIGLPSQRNEATLGSEAKKYIDRVSPRKPK